LIIRGLIIEVNMSDALSSWLAKPVTIAAASGAALRFGLGDVGLIVGGTRVPIAVAGAAMGLFSSYVSKLVSNFVVPMNGGDTRIMNLESMVVSFGSSALYFAVIPKILNTALTTAQMGQFAMYGAIGNLAGEFAYNSLVSPILLGNKSDYYM
jgi:hypothetical protein